ncbi:uncharacterized protein MONBRDRAFT_23011 [Monosiga brevicollis MX1]|uniref:Uncharacterized protein n=1 Tax=Monosiga brevicollis TaxID=81824 RepID=A9USR3_MONBE|nr:uncharacterized protein MONBRDRAFT_23011 [Monosiga brevicollis MX1]EDQ92148.1 predicted protein [Monosiga brevicollis MX1]|eukprot:XP_001743434.1 hypothetical protein [Monosiga brevicollis MX1]
MVMAGASGSTRWLRQVIFCACGTTLVLMLLLMISIIIIPYDLDTVAESMIGDDVVDHRLEEATEHVRDLQIQRARALAEQHRLSNTAHPDHSEPNRMALPKLREERQVKRVSPEQAALMDQILNPNVMTTKNLALCNLSQSQAGTPADNTAQAARELAALEDEWQKFAASYDTLLRDVKYCVAQCGQNRCCPDDQGFRYGADNDWFVVAKDDLAGMADDRGYDDITLVTQATFDRLDVFGMLANAWPGPKVAVFAVFDFDEASHAKAQVQIEAIIRTARDWTNVKILVYPVTTKDDYYTDRYRRHDPASEPQLPINVFRNLAVDHARTNFVFTCDMDFVPSSTLYPKLRQFLLPAMATLDRAAFVVPHWEALECDSTVRIPRDFEKLREYAAQGIVRPFHVTARRIMPLIKEIRPAPARCDAPSAVWSFGVQTTNYNKWFQESRDMMEGFFPLEVQGPLEDKYWEPFVIVKRVDASGARLPRYHEQYVGRYKNKISFITTLRGHHYRFYTLRREFLTHVPHPTANASAPAMHEHLLTMRKVHAADRQTLHDTAWTSPVKPKLHASPFDGGIHCLATQPSQPAAAVEQDPALQLEAEANAR